MKESINKLNYMRIKKRQVRGINEICTYEIKQEYPGIYFQSKITNLGVRRLPEKQKAYEAETARQRTEAAEATHLMAQKLGEGMDTGKNKAPRICLQ